MNIEVNVVNDKITAPPVSIVSGSKNYYVLSASFSEDWDGLGKYLIFPRNECSVAFDGENRVVLPESLTAKSGLLLFGIVGLSADGELRISTEPTVIRIFAGTDMYAAAPPSPEDAATWETYIGKIANGYIEEMKLLADSAAAAKASADSAAAKAAEAAKSAVEEAFSSTMRGYIWYIDSDNVSDNSGKSRGSLAACMTDDFIGTWFYVRTEASSAGSGAYPSKYEIDGANGYLSLGDYVIWTGKRLVHVSAYEAKASTAKNSDGLYSPKSGVDGLMSSTDKAYLTDLINTYWGKEKLPMYTTPDPAEGWQTNWLFDTGWYLGGIKKDCGGHPPVLNGNHTSWAVLVLNGMNTDADSINHNHRLQLAFDVVNSKIYMRRGWMSANSWADAWTEVGAVTDGSITEEKLSNELLERIDSLTSRIEALEQQLGGIN